MPRQLYPFALHQSFLDPRLTEDGKPYAPIRFRELVKECYVLTKNLNTSYNDTLLITPTERKYLISFLVDEAKQREAAIAAKKAEAAANKS